LDDDLSRKVGLERGWSAAFIMQLRKMLKNPLLLYLFVTLQWMLLIISLAVNAHVAVAVTGATADGGIKVIMLFQMWMLLFPIILCFASYRVKKGIVERVLLALSTMATLFSFVNISLHFVNDLLLLMKATEVAAWTLYNTLFAVSLYKISSLLLPSLLKRPMDVEKASDHNDKKTFA